MRSTGQASRRICKKTKELILARKNKPLPPIDWLEPRVKTMRWLSLTSFLGLMALLLGWNFWFADLHGARPWVISLIELAPLLLIAPGIVLGWPRTHAWAAFIVNLYFIKGVLACIDPNRMWLGVLEVSLSVVLFTCALYYTRWSYQLIRARAPKVDAPQPQGDQ